MAVAIKKSGFTTIKIYNGGIKDWVKAGHETLSIAPLPAIKVDFINVDALLKALTDADRQGCKDQNDKPLLTLIDFRMSRTLQTKCPTINAQLDDFIDNQTLIDSIPDTCRVISISETGNRDRFLIQYLSQFGKSNISGLEYGMRNWMKLNYPVKAVIQRDSIH